MSEDEKKPAEYENWPLEFQRFYDDGLDQLPGEPDKVYIARCEQVWVDFAAIDNPEAHKSFALQLQIDLSNEIRRNIKEIGGSEAIAMAKKMMSSRVGRFLVTAFSRVSGAFSRKEEAEALVSFQYTNLAISYVAEKLGDEMSRPLKEYLEYVNNMSRKEQKNPYVACVALEPFARCDLD